MENIVPFGKHGELNFKKKIAEIQVGEIYFCVKLFKNSVSYKRQSSMYLMWICEYCYNKDWLHGDVCIEILFRTLSRSRPAVSFHGSPGQQGTEKSTFGFLHVSPCLLGRHCSEKHLYFQKSRWPLTCWGGDASPVSYRDDTRCPPPGPQLAHVLSHSKETWCSPPSVCVLQRLLDNLQHIFCRNIRHLKLCTQVPDCIFWDVSDQTDLVPDDMS